MATEIKKPRIYLLDHVNNYFFSHQGKEIKSSDLKDLMLELGRDPKQAPAQVYLLVKRGDAVCVKQGKGTQPSYYVATPTIQHISASKTREYKPKYAELKRETPAGVLMLQNIFIPQRAPVRMWDEA